ncbi:Uncharacterised protein [Mycobacteroides abscessus subsp. abscessus]|nr:Uncharacterised protein [Mycobacteroides abscessus subsp. abscessus]
MIVEGQIWDGLTPVAGRADDQAGGNRLGIAEYQLPARSIMTG